MKRALALMGFLTAAALRPAAAAEIKVLAPADKSLVHGRVTVRIQPQNQPNETFFSNPEISVQDEMGTVLEKFPAPRDPATGTCSAWFDTTRLRDGLYLVTITYRALAGGAVPAETREDLSLGVRNGPARPAKFTVTVPDHNCSTDEQADVEVKVYDQRGKLMPGARVAFKVDKGEVNDEADISDGSGEVTTFAASDEPQTVTLTVTVESLPPVTKTLRFVQK